MAACSLTIGLMGLSADHTGTSSHSGGGVRYGPFFMGLRGVEGHNGGVDMLDLCIVMLLI
jgi:hypothetical protein